MKSTLLSFVVVVLTAAACLAAPPLMKAPGESTWSVTSGGKEVATVTLLSNGASGSRAEWKRGAGGPATIFLGGSGRVWVRGAGGDVELSSYSGSGLEKGVVPALLLPFTTSAADKVETPADKPWSYSYAGARARYEKDARGVSRIDVTAGGSSYIVTRQSVTDRKMDAALFAVRPKQAAASRLARLSGDLLGPSDRSVSATAGGRGVGGSGLKFSDGGDYGSLEKLERRDAAWKEKLAAALGEFQKDGKVGKERPQ
jgi:hypothetical protein